MTATTLRSISPMFHPGPEPVSRFSSDGEESFVGFPYRGKFQDLTGPDIVINGKVDDFNIGMERSPRSSFRASSPTQIPKHPTLLRRLTTKLGIATPPPSPPSTVLSFHPRSPTYATTTPHVNSFLSTELSESALREQGLLFPEDSNLQRKAQDIYFSAVQNERDDEEWMTEAERVKETWEAKHLGITAPAAESGRAVSPLQSKGPIYPDVLATPQFGKSRSTPNLMQLEPSKLQIGSRTETDDESAAAQSTATAPAFRRSLLEPIQPPKLPTNIQGRHRTSSSASSPPIFLSPHKWIRSTRGVSPVPVDANAPFASSTSLASGSSRSFISSGGNSFLTDERFMYSMSAGFPPQSSRRYPVSGESSERASVDEAPGTTHNNPFGVTTRNLDIERTPTIVKRRVEDDELAASIVVQVEGDPDVTRLHFPSRQDPGANSREAQKAFSISPGSIRPRASDLHRAGDAENASSFQGRTQRRKSFVEQSFQNLRKSITVTISRARPRPPSKSLPVHSTFDTSQLPPSPTFPPPSPTFPISSSARPRFPSSTWRGKGAGLKVPERTVLDLRRYTIEER